MSPAHQRENRLPASKRLTVAMTALAQDPAIVDAAGVPLTVPLTVRLDVPADLICAGPRGHRFHVVDYDASTNVFRAPRPIAPSWSYSDRYRARAGSNGLSLAEDPDFHAQHVYAVASRTLGVFERALGRRVAWSFDDHELFLVPHAFEEENAFYSPDDRAILFGYFEGPAGRVNTCLSHDIVAHETTHAILDGLRPGLEEPGLPDQPAFHEAFADVVALLSLITLAESVDRILALPDPEGLPAGDGAAGPPSGRIAASLLSPAALRRSILTGIGEQFGRAVGSGASLRQSAARRPERDWALRRPEPHDRGDVLVYVMLDVLIRMWTRRLAPLVDQRGTVDRARASEEGAKAAEHLLQMSIRALDYCPPLELEFADFAAAILRSDRVTAPDDPHGYRDAVRAGFRSVGVEADPGRIDDVAGNELVAPGALNVAALRQSPDEVYRFIWANARRLGISRDWRVRVDPLAFAERVGPDGLLVSEIIACYTQSLDTTIGEWPAGRAPSGIPASTRVDLLGGGVLIFDQFGLLRFHVVRPLQDWDRQRRRLEYLNAGGFFDSSDRLGFSLGDKRGQRFAALHRPSIDDDEGFR